MVVMEKFPNQRLRSDCLGLCFFLYHFVLHLAILCESFNHHWVTESLHHHRQCYRVFLWQSVKHNLDRRMHLSRMEQRLESRQYYFPSMKVTFSWNTSFFFSVCESAIAEKNTRNASIIRRVSQMPFSGCKCLVFCYGSPCFLQSS